MNSIISNRTRLQFAVIIVLFLCLLVTVGECARLKWERATAILRAEDFTSRIVKENARLKAEIDSQRQADLNRARAIVRAPRTCSPDWNPLEYAEEERMLQAVYICDLEACLKAYSAIYPEPATVRAIRQKPKAKRLYVTGTLYDIRNVTEN